MKTYYLTPNNKLWDSAYHGKFPSSGRKDDAFMHEIRSRLNQINPPKGEVESLSKCYIEADIPRLKIRCTEWVIQQFRYFHLCNVEEK